MMDGLLRELAEAFGVSGSEDEVRKVIAREVRPNSDDLRADSIGNLIAFKQPSGGNHDAAPRLMLCAHMDEVGLMVVGIDDNGRLRFRKVGGISDNVLLSKIVLVGKDKVAGVIGARPVHLMKAEERRRSVKVEAMYIDIGASSKKDAERIVRIGDPVCFATDYSETDQAIRGKALDDRAGCRIVADALKNRYPYSLYGTFSVQEEVGLRGARVAAYSVRPDVALVIETTVCDDLPNEKDINPVSVLGNGPAITLMDRSFIADKTLVSLIIEEAEAHSIPYQIKQPHIGSTDAGAIHLAGEGVPTAVIAVPCRYIHSPLNMISKSDYENAAKLLSRVLERLGREWPFQASRR